MELSIEWEKGRKERKGKEENHTCIEAPEKIILYGRKMESRVKEMFYKIKEDGRKIREQEETIKRMKKEWEKKEKEWTEREKEKWKEE